MLAVMAAIAPVMINVVAGEFEGGKHLLISEKPVAAVNIQIVAAVLQENADGLRLGFADQGRIVVAAAQADISPDAGEDAPESIRPLPGCGKGANTTATRTGNRAVVAVSAEVEL